VQAVPSHCTFYDGEPCSILKFYSRAARLYFKQFGNGCDDKRISPALFKCSGLLPLVSGFIDGDGSQRKDAARDVNIYTNSETLAWQLRQILIDNGIWCTLQPNSERILPHRATRRTGNARTY
jgi:hypothetical protein